MQLSLSNIAWSLEENDAIVEIMHHHGISGVDFALSKVLKDPLTATDAEITTAAAYWTNNNIHIAGAQSIHFGHPELQLFGSETERQQMIDFTNQMIVVAAKLGVSAIVFGSPKNRVRGDIELAAATEIAIDAFRQMGAVAVANNTCIVIEPNAADYGCDFIRTAEEGLSFVKAVNHPGVRLHLDTGSMAMMKEDMHKAIHNSIEYLQHFHVAEPQLGPVGASDTEDKHRIAAAALRDAGYKNWVTVEMRDGVTTPNTQTVEAAALFVAEIYG
jgi:sugar phosphate isomerase/epimerase